MIKYNYSISDIKDLVTEFRSYPKKYLKDTNINGFVHLILEFIDNLKEITGRIDFEIGKDNFGLIKFHIHEEFEMAYWFKAPYSPIPYVNPSFMPLNAYSTKFNLRLYDRKHTLRYEMNYSKGKTTNRVSTMQNCKCLTIEFDFVLDKEIWSYFKLTPEKVIQQIKNIDPNYLDLDIKIQQSQ